MSSSQIPTHLITWSSWTPTHLITWSYQITWSHDHLGHPWSMYGGCMLPENTNRAIARITLPSFSKHPVIKCCVFPARACVWCVAGLKVLKTSSYCPGFENSNPASFIQTELHIVAQPDNYRAWLGLGTRKRTWKIKEDLCLKKVFSLGKKQDLVALI